MLLGIVKTIQKRSKTRANPSNAAIPTGLTSTCQRQLIERDSSVIRKPSMISMLMPDIQVQATA